MLSHLECVKGGKWEIVGTKFDGLKTVWRGEIINGQRIDLVESESNQDLVVLFGVCLVLSTSM